MAVRTIDGTIEEVELKARRKLGSVYSRILFRLPDGGSETVGKSIVWNNVADRLKPGTSGRFYLYSAMDHRGIHGIRTVEGDEVFGFGKQNEIVAIAVLVMAALTVYLTMDSAGESIFQRFIWLISVLLLVAGGPMYLAYRHTRVQAERQFQADQGYRPLIG